MLDTKRMKENKDRFLILLKEVLHEEEYEELEAYLEETDFFEAPASTKYHLHVKGGLCQHSLNVYDCLVDLVETWNLKCSDTSVRIVALLHDVCKADTYVPSTRRVPPERSKTGKWEVEEIWTKDDTYHLGHASKSIYLLQRILPLTMEEIEAIHAHMGSTDLSTMFNSFDLNAIFSENRLAICLHLADMMASYLLEDDFGNKECYEWERN